MSPWIYRLFSNFRIYKFLQPGTFPSWLILRYVLRRDRYIAEKCESVAWRKRKDVMRVSHTGNVPATWWIDQLLYESSYGQFCDEQISVHDRHVIPEAAKHTIIRVGCNWKLIFNLLLITVSYLKFRLFKESVKFPKTLTRLNRNNITNENWILTLTFN